MKNAPEFDQLKASLKALVRKLGSTDDHMIESGEGTVGKGWTELEDLGWIRVRTGFFSGYTITFTIEGWEWWCRQCDAEEGLPLTPCEYSYKVVDF